MNFLDSLFGKKQPVPPEATKMHEVITAMCAKPGPTNDKSSRSASFYALLPTSSIPKDVADLFVDVTTFTTVFMMGPDLRDSMAALEKLCTIKGKVVNNLLHCIAA